MFAGVASLWRQDEWRALLFGLVYVLAYAVISQFLWQAHLRTLRYRRHHLRAEGDAERPTPPVLREILGLVAALGYPSVMVVAGIYSPGDVGIRAPEWGTVAGPLVLGALGATAWLGMLWHERRTPDAPAGAPPAADAGPLREAEAPALPFALTGALMAEGHLAVCRAALMPLLGSYWGLWMGVVLRMLTAHSNPSVLVRLGHPQERRRVYLDWALDWVSTAALALSGSLWAGLIVRALCRTALHLTVLRSAGAVAPAPSGQSGSAWESSVPTGG